MTRIPPSIQRLLYSRIMLVVSGIICVSLFFQLVRVVTRTSQTDKEIKSLEKEVASLEADQQHLQQLRSFLQTDYFAEREARTKFGLQKAGEKTVIITEGGVNDDSLGAEGSPYQKTEDDESSSEKKQAIQENGVGAEKPYRLWSRYFFGKTQ